MAPVGTPHRRPKVYVPAREAYRSGMARKLSKQQLEANRLRALAAKADAELAVQHARAVLDKIRNTVQRRLNKRALELHSFKKK
jgi:hypothetical protein